MTYDDWKARDETRENYDGFPPGADDAQEDEPDNCEMCLVLPAERDGLCPVCREAAMKEMYSPDAELIALLEDCADYCVSGPNTNMALRARCTAALRKLKEAR